MLVVWHEILQKFHRTSQTLQKEELAVCGDLYNSLAVYLNDMREHFDSFEKTAKDMLMLTTKEQRLAEEEKTDNNDGDAADAAEELNATERFRVFTFCSVTDTLSTEMERRSQVYKMFQQSFHSSITQR